MPDPAESTPPSPDNLLAKVEELRRTSEAAMATFRSIEARLQELAVQIEKSRKASQSSGVWRPAEPSRGK